MGDKDGAQHLIALEPSGRQAPLDGEGRRALGRRDTAGRAGTPTVDGDLVYAIGTEGDLVCLEAATGKERWRKSLPATSAGAMMSVWKFSESPLVDGDRLVFTPGAQDAALVAVDKKTGKEIWRAAVPDLGPQGQGRRRLLVDRGLERRRA